MVHPNGFLDEEDILADEEMEAREMEGQRPSLSRSLLDLEEEMEFGSQLDQGSEGHKDGQSSVLSRAPSLAASHDLHASLDMFSQSVCLNSSMKGSSGSGPSRPVPGQPDFGVLARPAPGVSTEVDKPKDEAREKSLAETLESLIGKPPWPDENTITLGLVGFSLARRHRGV